MLVSAIMSTRNRRRFVPRAIQCFLEQSWPERELVVLDDGADPVVDLMPADPRIRYAHAGGPLTLAEKRRQNCDMASGDVMAFWDDDDWHGPGRLEAQANALRRTGKGACLLDHVVFHDVPHDRWWRWAWPHGMFVGTLAFTRRYYDLGPFMEHNRVLSDQYFVYEKPRSELVYVDGAGLYVADRHGENNYDAVLVEPCWEATKPDSTYTPV